jgi:type VI secretion system secreted protein Hcp
MISYMSVNGRKQGQFRGETVSARRRDKWMPVVAIAMDLKSPHDAATGQISGKRQWAPVVVTKNWGAASPQGLSACAANEVLTDVVNRVHENERRRRGIRPISG